MTAPPFHRKIGGIHWFALGRVRIGVCCLQRPKAAPSQSKAVPKRESALPVGFAHTRARIPRLPRTAVFPWPPEAKQ